MAEDAEPYAARLQVDYPDTLDRVTTLLRAFWIIPIAIILGLQAVRVSSHKRARPSAHQVVAFWGRSRWRRH
jgi:hypothetical protein